MLYPKLVAEVIEELKKQETYAKYEKDLLRACHNWLKNFNRRKYS
jgi:hypothetical protein